MPLSYRNLFVAAFMFVGSACYDEHVEWREVGGVPHEYGVPLVVVAGGCAAIELTVVGRSSGAGDQSDISVGGTDAVTAEDPTVASVEITSQTFRPSDLGGLPFGAAASTRVTPVVLVCGRRAGNTLLNIAGIDASSGALSSKGSATAAVIPVEVKAS